jgi:hypothetical protein
MAAVNSAGEKKESAVPQQTEEKKLSGIKTHSASVVYVPKNIKGPLYHDVSSKMPSHHDPR